MYSLFWDLFDTTTVHIRYPEITTRKTSTDDNCNNSLTYKGKTWTGESEGLEAMDKSIKE